MKTTIDKAGRVIIPAQIRAKAGLRPGTELEVILDDYGIRLVRSVSGPEVVGVGRQPVPRPDSGFVPVRVQGPPVSSTIIADRR